MEITNKPQFNDIKIGDEYQIGLPVWVWVQIGSYLQFIDDNSQYVFPNGMNMLIEAINDMSFPREFQQTQKAMFEKHKQERAESHPFVQMMKGFPGVQIETIPNPEDFIGPDDSNS